VCLDNVAHDIRRPSFVGSDDGAEVNTIFVSLLTSCRLHDIALLAYMRDLFCLLPSWPKNRVLQLARSTGSKRSSSPTLRTTPPSTARPVREFVVAGHAASR
jgi:hypothetical protein